MDEQENRIRGSNFTYMLECLSAGVCSLFGYAS